MKILIIGAGGTIGRKVTAHFAADHEIISAGRTSGDIIMDISDTSSIEAMYKTVDGLDAVICCAGEAKWASLSSLSEEDFYIGIKSKLMGQVNLVRIGQHYLNQGGSFTLTTGILADHPVVKTTSAAMVNGALHSFVRAAALELKNNIRINVVSASVVEDAYEKYADYFPGYNPIPMDRVVSGYKRSVAGSISGEVIRLYDY